MTLFYKNCNINNPEPKSSKTILSRGLKFCTEVWLTILRFDDNCDVDFCQYNICPGDNCHTYIFKIIRPFLGQRDFYGQTCFWDQNIRQIWFTLSCPMLLTKVKFGTEDPNLDIYVFVYVLYEINNVLFLHSIFLPPVFFVKIWKQLKF